jgi:hypothetical protein
MSVVSILLFQDLLVLLVLMKTTIGPYKAHYRASGNHQTSRLGFQAEEVLQRA